MKVNNSLPILALTLLLCGPAAAQTFSSGSNGSDGALNLTGQSGTILFNPASFNPPLDQDHDNVYHFTTITIPNGVTLRLSASVLGIKPVVWLVSGNVQIGGGVDLKGDAGHPVGGVAMPSIAGAGGYSGGAGKTSTSPAQRGNGPGGALAAGGGGGHVVAGGGGSNVGGAPYGNDFLLPLVGGSGGAGASATNGGGGGAGGGALLIASSGSISFSAGSLIYAYGGDAGCGFSPPAAEVGGGGSGGAIRLMAQSISGITTLNAIGGGTCAGSGAGSQGRIRIEAFQRNLTGSVSPAPVVASPGLVFPPASAPAVRITSIGGVAAPANPTGSFMVPDVTLDNATSVTIQLTASKVPVGTVVHLTLTPETGSIQTADSTPLAGTFDASTASATVTIAHGFSRFSIQASWTP